MISHTGPKTSGSGGIASRGDLAKGAGARGEVVERGMRLFLNTFVNKIDRKGRVSVPATFRAVLADQSFPGIVAFRSFTAAACIEGGGMDRMESLSASTDQLGPFSTELDDLTSLIFADARQLPFDTEGRIVLPEDLIAHAGLAESCAFVGKGKTFQIWEPQAFATAQDEARRRAMANRPSLIPGPGLIPGRPAGPPPGGDGA